MPYGWQGADAAYSVPLHDGRDLWIFGDTLFGPRRAMKNGEPEMVHSSLGLSRCSPDGIWSISYLLRKAANGTPTSMFAPQTETHWYWPMDAFTSHQDVFVSLLCLKKPVTAKPPAFNFETCGLDLARMPVAQTLPEAEITVQPLVGDGGGAYPSSTVVVSGRYAYFFGVREIAGQPLLVMRVPLRHLRNAQGWQQYLAQDGDWRKGFDPTRAKTILHPAPTEMTIRYHPRWRSWIAVYKDPDLASDHVLLRSSPSLLGPWSEPKTLFTIRALDPAASRPGVFCYAGKEHPELAAPGELLVTYVCNTFDPAELINDQNLYRPRPVRVRLDHRLNVVWAHAIP